MEFFEVVKQRYSVRSYKPDQVEAEKLQMILEAARLAPTAANRQAFKLVVVKTEGRKDELKQIYPREWFTQAPLILVVCSVPGECWVRYDQKNYSDVDAAIIMDHVILAATALGLGTCWIGAFNLPATKQILNLDDALEPVAMTPLGYAQETAFKKVRKSLDDLVIYR